MSNNNPHNLQLGQKVWLIDVLDPDMIRDGTITSLNFETIKVGDLRFDTNDLSFIPDGASNWVVFLDKESADEGFERLSIYHKIQTTPTTLDQLRRIAAIIDETS